MQLVVRGRLNKQIASEMGTSEVTVKMHRGQSVVELLRMAETIAPSGVVSSHTKV
jgi:FixJ family two-component response regulator